MILKVKSEGKIKDRCEFFKEQDDIFLQGFWSVFNPKATNTCLCITANDILN